MARKNIDSRTEANNFISKNRGMMYTEAEWPEGLPIGKKFFMLRHYLGVSLRELSDRTGNKISRQGILYFEQGHGVFMNGVFGALCKALNVDPKFFNGTTFVFNIGGIKMLHKFSEEDIEVLYKKTYKPVRPAKERR